MIFTRLLDAYFNIIVKIFGDNTNENLLKQRQTKSPAEYKFWLHQKRIELVSKINQRKQKGSKVPSSWNETIVFIDSQLEQNSTLDR